LEEFRLHIQGVLSSPGFLYVHPLSQLELLVNLSVVCASGRRKAKNWGYSWTVSDSSERVLCPNMIRERRRKVELHRSQRLWQQSFSMLEFRNRL
jgi:hypothetical protein